MLLRDISIFLKKDCGWAIDYDFKLCLEKVKNCLMLLFFKLIVSLNGLKKLQNHERRFPERNSKMEKMTSAHL